MRGHQRTLEKVVSVVINQLMIIAQNSHTRHNAFIPTTGLNYFRTHAHAYEIISAKLK
jgi:hypothetical protein